MHVGQLVFQAPTAQYVPAIQVFVTNIQAKEIWSIEWTTLRPPEEDKEETVNNPRLGPVLR